MRRLLRAEHCDRRPSIKAIKTPRSPVHPGRRFDVTDALRSLCWKLNTLSQCDAEAGRQTLALELKKTHCPRPCVDRRLFAPRRDRHEAPIKRTLRPLDESRWWAVDIQQAGVRNGETANRLLGCGQALCPRPERAVLQQSLKKLLLYTRPGKMVERVRGGQMMAKAASKTSVFEIRSAQSQDSLFVAERARFKIERIGSSVLMPKLEKPLGVCIRCRRVADNVLQLNIRCNHLANSKRCCGICARRWTITLGKSARAVMLMEPWPNAACRPRVDQMRPSNAD